MTAGHDPAEAGQGAPLRRIRAGWLVDGTGGPVLTGALLEVRGERISAVYPDGAASEKEADLDCSHATILPLLMDAHVHLALSGRVDPAFRKDQLAYDAAGVAQAVGRHLRDQWRCGVSAVRDAGDRLGAVPVAARAHAETSVTARTTCWAWHAPGRYGAMLGRAVPEGMGLSQAVSDHLHDCDHVKIIQSGINSLDRFGHCGPPQFEFSDLTAAVRLAHAAGKPVMAHANGETAVQQAIEAGCDSIEHGYFMGRDNLRRLVDHDCVWVPTAVPMAALVRLTELTPAQREVARRTVADQLAQIAFAHAIGVKMGLGTDAGSVGVMHGEAARQELALLVQAGLSIERAVHCATGVNARLLGLADRGTLAPGRRADLLIVPGPPQRLLENPPVMDGLCSGRAMA